MPRARSRAIGSNVNCTQAETRGGRAVANLLHPQISAAAAVVGSRFAVDLVERVVEQDLVDAFDEACKAGIVVEELGGHYRFNHALIRQSMLAELPSVRRMRLHQRIATTLESEPGAWNGIARRI